MGVVAPEKKTKDFNCFVPSHRDICSQVRAGFFLDINYLLTIGERRKHCGKFAGTERFLASRLSLPIKKL